MKQRLRQLLDELRPKSVTDYVILVTALGWSLYEIFN